MDNLEELSKSLDLDTSPHSDTATVRSDSSVDLRVIGPGYDRYSSDEYQSDSSEVRMSYKFTLDDPVMT